MVSERRADREEHVREAAMVLRRKELEKADIPAQILDARSTSTGIYDKMAKKGRELN